MAEGFPSLSHAPSAFPLPTIAEDTLHYVLHLPASSTRTEADEVALATLISTYVESLLTHPWLWNKDAWELKAGHGKLEGTMRVGDAVDDEWLVVWLLREVSKRWPELVISIRDSDGEFLLIEAAHELPAWVSPENADNRLWLAGGHLHLLPLSVRSSGSSVPKQLADDKYDDAGHAVDPDAQVTEADAIAAVRTGKYQAPDVERAVWERIACYPDALKTHQHRTKVYLPVPIARALREAPELIQRAVEGFYVRDPAQLRAAARMTHFPPSPSVLASVLMSRAAYAQLQGQVFHPPRVFGPEWHVPEGDEDEHRWRDLGVKVATGFEIMYREGGRKGRTADAETSTAGLESKPEYQKYIADLKTAGFFGDELQGSAKWKEREQVAAKGWIDAQSSDTTQERPSFAYLVDKAIDAGANVPVSELEVSKDSPEDSDKWLEISPDELDTLMTRASGAKTAASGEPAPKLDDEQGKALADLASKVQEFVGGQGDMTGARFADELSDEDMDTDSEDEEAKPSEAERQERLAKLVPSLPAEEWGRKQPAHEDVEMAPSHRPQSSKETPLTETLLPNKMRPPVFSKPEYDGVVSDSSDEEDDELAPAGTLGRKIGQMKWADTAPEATIEEIDDDEDEGAGSDKEDKARAKSLRFNDRDIDEQMRQRVWGADDEPEETAGDDMDVDMGEEEEEFLKFARESLGISPEQWDSIVKSREERGAFVPKPSTKAASASTSAAAKNASLPVVQATEVEEPPRAPDMSLNSFESVMAAMEAELARANAEGGAAPAPTGPPTGAGAVPFVSKKPKAAGTPKAKGKLRPGKGKASSLMTLPTEDDIDNMDDEALAAMDAELRQALRDAGADSDDELGAGADEPAEAKNLQGDAAAEYKMMRDLLESAKSGGGAGAAGNLFGRLQQNK
ncbi:hypothetical protein Q8F55_006522 [Vanrija albida]|uniref:SGT1-domain-containing protein n=1 Tax=Vanrija albida TaxID=181172 RepID=A0ABR3PXD8_9TREE